MTSLFDGSLTRAFSIIVSSLIPRFEALKSNLLTLAQSICADRIILCDASTFLPIFDNASDRPEQTQPFFDYFLRIYPKKKHLKTMTFEANNAVVVFTIISELAGIFVSASNQNITTDSIMFNIHRALPLIQELVQVNVP